MQDFDRKCSKCGALTYSPTERLCPMCSAEESMRQNRNIRGDYKQPCCPYCKSPWCHGNCRV